MSEIDYDLRSCLEYNPQSFAVQDVAKVLAVWEGENDGDDWRWVIQLTDGRYAFVQGGCDYTGWDCQSWATSEFADTAEAAAKLALGDQITTSEEQHPANAGVGHMLNIMTGEYMKNAQDIVDALLKQVTEGKNETWREKTDKELGVNS